MTLKYFGTCMSAGHSHYFTAFVWSTGSSPTSNCFRTYRQMKRVSFVLFAYRAAGRSSTVADNNNVDWHILLYHKFSLYIVHFLRKYNTLCSPSETDFGKSSTATFIVMQVLLHFTCQTILQFHSN